LYNGVIVEKEPRIIKIKTDSYYPTVNPAYAEYDINGYNKDGYNRQGFRKNADLSAQTTQRSPATTPSLTISATPEATPTKIATTTTLIISPTSAPMISATPETTQMEIDDGNKKDNGSNILEWIKEQIENITTWQNYGVMLTLIHVPIDFVLGYGKKYLINGKTLPTLKIMRLEKPHFNDKEED
jgi:hypothetical protein